MEHYISFFNFFISFDFVFRFPDTFSRSFLYFMLIMAEQFPNLFGIRTSSFPSFQLIPFGPDNAEACFRCAEANFEHGVSDTRAQFVAVMRELSRDFLRQVTPGMLTSDVWGHYETLKRAFLN